MSIFKYLNYLKIIEELAQFRRISYKHLAQSTSIHTSYFSRVMMDKAHFSAEQMYLIGKVFEFNTDEMEYFTLLGELARSSTPTYKNFLKKKIDVIREKKLKLTENLSQVQVIEKSQINYQSYYQEALTAKIHMLLCSSKYRESVHLIAKKLSISDSKLNSELEKLKNLSIIKIEKNKILMLKESIHLDEHDPLSPLNHVNWRLETIHKLTKKDYKASDYHLTVNFTANEETKLAIKQVFKDFVLQIQKMVMKAPADESYSMSFDLYGDN